MMINKFLVKDRKANRSRRMSCIVMCSLLLMAVCTAGASFTYGRYLQSESNTFSPQIAVMRTEVSVKPLSVSVDNLNNPSRKTVNFQVKKQVSTTEKSEVSFSYSIFLKVPEDFPDYISVDLCANVDNTVTKVAEGKIDNQQKTITFDKTFYFTPSSISAQNFVLQFTVTDLAAVPIGGRTIDNIYIYVHFEQIQFNQIQEGA